MYTHTYIDLVAEVSGPCTFEPPEGRPNPWSRSQRDIYIYRERETERETERDIADYCFNVEIKVPGKTGRAFDTEVKMWIINSTLT